ncbi:inosine triphosphate pyrophosphatase [Monosporozyma unispora]|nr:nucleoside triphosphate pyrophosphohydrolase ham1 [Kazachstania unispora]
MRDIVFVTGNANKLKEVKMLLASETLNLTNEPLDLDELQDTNLVSIATDKCKQAIKILGPGKEVFVEDTALTFDEFNGLPGAYIKWFVKSMGLDKIVKMLDSFENKGAEAITTIAYADSKGEIHIFQGITKGKIVPSRGSLNFGWDSIFEPLDTPNLTYAELSKEEKNKISHRAKAFEHFKAYLDTLN